MKYYLSTAGKKCCADCTWLLSLAKNEKGYDLIQFKRGFAEHRDLMKLYPGEPAVILDTGEFYIGDAAGNPILINPNGAAIPQSGNVLCIKNQSDWSQGDEIVVNYDDMITSDKAIPTSASKNRYSCAVILDEKNVPIGIAFCLDWCYSDTEAQFLVGYFNYTDLGDEFTPDDIDAIIQHAEARLESEN